MLRATIILSVILILAGCAMAGQPGGTQQLTPAPTPQPTLEPTLASSVLMQRRNERIIQYDLGPVDPATGEPVAGFTPIALGRYGSSVYALSIDGTSVAAVESQGQVTEGYAGGTSHWPRADVLHVVELRTQREVTATLSGDGWATALAFSPDASQVALVENTPDASRLMTFDTKTGAPIAERTIEFRPALLTYAEHGQTLVVYGQAAGTPAGMGQPPPPQVLLLDAGTLEPLWEHSLDTVASGFWCLEQCTEQHGRHLFVEWQPALAPAQDGHRLYIVHADEARLTTVDFDSRTVGSVLIQEKQSWLGQLFGIGVAEAKGGMDGATKVAVFSSDGTRLYVAEQIKDVIWNEEGYWEPVETDIEVRVVDVETGHVLANGTIDTPGLYTFISDIALIPEHGSLLVSGWSDGGGWAQAFDAQELEPVAHVADWEVRRAQQLDGRPILMAHRWQREQRMEFAVLNSQTLDVVESWETADAWVVTP